GYVDLTPMLDREVSLSGASAEPRTMKGATPPATTVITDFSR
ncbi:MAG TPA: alcohol dehydrogenase, partial [Rhodobacteraceae bacterium]|nr:alcohol dehydrogenase [Paracoccaceae bacterium]